tara:strand:+ start:441 stop:605 length:165 start_codon:yes stop_codon:yes gene_type:complete
MGHEYYDKDEVFNSYIKDMAKDWVDDTIEEIDESALGPDVLLTVERVQEQVLAA